MRVTCAVREYVRKVVLDKVKDRVRKADLAKEKALAERDAKIAKVREIAKEVAEKAQEAFVKRAAKLGLTWVPDVYDYRHKLYEKNDNLAFDIDVNQNDFAETMSSNCYASDAVKSAERDGFEKTCGEPDRIRKAATAAADKLLFELELGKVAKQELDKLLNELDVEV